MNNKKRGKKVGILTPRQRENIEKIAKEEKIARQTKYDVFSVVTKNAKAAMNDLAYLAKYLPEKLQSEIFTPKNMQLLTKEILGYSVFPEIIKMPSAGRGKGSFEGQELKRDKIFRESPKRGHLTLPKNIRQMIPSEQRKSDRIWRQVAGERIVHPSFKRHIELARFLFREIYTQLLQKFDPQRGQFFDKASFILTITKDKMRVSRKGGWLSKILEKSKSEEWFQQTIEEWLNALNNEIGPLDPRMKEWIEGLISNLLFNLIKNDKSILTDSKIIVLS